MQGPTFSEEDRIYILAEMAVTVIHFPSINEDEGMHVYGNLELPSNCTLWSRVLNQLAVGNNWEAVCLLILGWPGCPDNPFEGVAADCATNDIIIRDLLCSVNEVALKTWGINLAICLLKKGADVATVARTADEPIPISALITALQTGVHDLFKYIMENIPSARAQIDSKDRFGETAIHIIVKSGKTDSFSGEALLKLLLNYGCATDVRDRYGKLPIDYIDQKSPVFGILRKTSQNTDNSLHKKVAYLREAGNKAQKENNNTQALKHYEAAISLLSGLGTMNTELAILHSNCSLVLSNMGDMKQALTAAHNAVMANSTFYKGYWRLGQVYKSTGHFSESYDVFVSGLVKAEHPDEDSKTLFLLEIAKLLPPLENAGSPLLNRLSDISKHYCACWPKVLETLSKSGNWTSVKILVMGMKYKPKTVSKIGMIVKDIDFRPSPHGIAASFPASSVVLSSIVDAPEAAAWADELIMVLLIQNASLETLTVSTNTPSLHIVLRLCISTGNVALLSLVLTSDRQLAQQKHVQDDKGNTLFHVICQLSASGELAVGIKLAEMLLEHNFDATLHDNRGMRPLDLVPQASSLGKLLAKTQNVKPPEPNYNANAKSLKEEGNKEYKKQNYIAAIHHYTQAIEHLSDLAHTKEIRHDLSVLFGNRAECHLRLGRPDMALEDAKTSVGYDPDWYKAHTRVGRLFIALKKDKKAMIAFVNAYNCLPSNADDVVQIEILSEVIVLFHQVEGKAKPGSQIPGLKQVNSSMWVKTAYYFIRQKCIWEHAFLAFRQFKHKQLKMSVDLRPFCNKDEMSMNIWSLEFLVLLLRGGSDHRTLTFKTGDTYLHAGVFTYFLTGMETVFKWLLDNRAVSHNEQNIQDTDGNTVLHFTIIIPCPIEYKEVALSLLLACGASPLIVNKYNMKPLHCVASNEQRLKKLLVSAENNFSKPQFSKGPQTMQNEPNQRAPKTNRDRLKLTHDPCNVCEKLLSDAKGLFPHGEYQIGIRKLVEVIMTNHKGEKHQRLASQSADLIVDELGIMLTPDIPDEMMKLSVAQYKSILEKFAKKDKWRQIVAAVQKYDLKHGQVKLATFATNISLMHLVESSSLRGSESLRLQILDLILTHGAVLSADEGVMKAAISRMELKVVEWLIDHGVSPALFRLTPGDTPMHAALSVALEKDKGNFVLFEKFLDLFNEDPGKYKFLNPARLDRDGNSLLHIASKCKFNKYSLKAVEILCAQQVPADVTNSEGKMPIQYLTDRNDRRAQFLRITIPAATRPKAKSTTGGRHKDKPATNGTDLSSSCDHQVKIPKRGIESVESSMNEMDIRVSAVSVESVQGCREHIRELICELPESSFSIFKPDGAKQLGSKVKKPENIPPPSPLTAEKISSTEGDVPEGDTEKAADSLSENMELEAEDAEIDVEEDSPTKLHIDPNVFDNMEWEVECTADVWKTLKDKHLLPEMKQRVIRRIQLLASGEWRPYLYKSVSNASPTLKLFEAKLSKGARIIWELAIAFSPRLSEAAERRLGLDNNPENNFAVKGGRIYSEIIRVWDIVLDHDNLCRAVEKIIKSHERGEGCILQRKLKGIKDEQFRGTTVKKRVPMLYAEEDDDVDLVAVRKHQQSLKLYPPASPQETEYHILKFYSFSSTLVSNILQNHDIKVDFPFRVTDTEHAIINLESKSPILLLGRSGTGKTTCCLYRLWTIFSIYWTKAKEAGGPLLPREHQFIEEEEENSSDIEEVDADLEVSVTASSSTDSGILTEIPSTSSVCREEYDEDFDDDEYTGPVYDHLHQLFVTKNTVLCSEVHKNFGELCHASDITEEHVKMENDILPNRLQDVNDFLYPLFLTSRQLLLILDASLNPPYFFDRNDDGSLKVVIQGWGTQEDLFGYTPLDHDSDAEQSDDDDDDDQDDMLDEPMAEHAAAAAKKLKMDPRREVTYDVFANEVWPKIRKKMSVDYHPTLVWTEIMSFIRGSFEALTKPNGILKKDEYIELGRKRAPNFSGERDKIYALFLRYDHFKTQKFLFDESDLIYSIYKRLRNLDDQPWVLHQMYVDETQDFTQAELAILIRITQNPNNMFLTGDTAQSIMRGISFRFSDLKTLFYYAKKSLHAVGKTRSIEVPKQVYQLTHNYRSHAGILSLASAILDLMVEFFPESFDRLQKDQGLFQGPPPVLLESCSPGDLAILLQGNKRKTSHIEFGAHQAILVVNDAARDSIPEELRLGLILTIYEAKGLEFDDVLLYNFFKDSYAFKEWRVVTDFLEKLRENVDTKDQCENLVLLDEDVLRQSSRPRPLTFNPNQHKVLNSELKHLYTALTRARVNVWIFDESEEKRAPMFEYFKARRLVRVVSSYSDEELDLDSTIFAEKSSPADWEKRGDEIMKRFLYDVAAKCYKMAGSETKEKIANAHNQALKASRMKDNPRKMREEYMFAARTFLECNILTKAALCLQNAHEYELAAQVFEKGGQLLQAARMYQRSKKLLDCSRCYEQLGYFNRAVNILYKEELYDQAIDCLRRHKMILEDLKSREKTVPQVILDNQPQEAYTEERLTYKSAELFARYNNKTKMVAALERLSRVEEKINFLKKHDYPDEAAEYLIKEGKTTEAVQLMLKNGKLEEALAAAEKGRDMALIGECHFIMSQFHSAKPDSTKDVVHHLNKAVESFQAAGDNTGLGKALVVLARIKIDKTLAKRAFKHFQEETPNSNDAGMLEALQVVLELSSLESEFEDFIAIIRGIEKTFHVIEKLFKQTSNEDKARAQLYYRFFGLYQISAKPSHFEIHPKERPRCIEVIEDFFEDRKERKEAVIERERIQICVSLCRFLVGRMKEWLNKVESAFRQQVPHNMQCKAYLEGSECEDEDVCPYMHQMYTQSAAFEAIKLFAWDVNLSYIVQTGVNMVKKLDIPELSEEVGYLVEEDTKYDPCERLLDFLMPLHHHPRFLSAVVRYLHRQWSNSNVSKQIEKYLQNLWINPSAKEKKDLCKERCRSTDWVLRIGFFASLMKLTLDVSQYCHQLENQLMTEAPHWLAKRSPTGGIPYALFIDYHNRKLIVVCVAYRFIEAFRWLQGKEADPMESIIKFTKFVKVLSFRDRPALLPAKAMMLFWLEIFVSLSFFLLAKLSTAGTHFVLPATYLAAVNFVDLSFRKESRPIQELVHLYKNQSKIKLLLDRLQIIVGLVCGYKSPMSLLRLLFTQTKDDYLAAERCLVLTLVFLVNVGLLLPSLYEDHIMRSVMRLRLPDSAPQRLHMTLQAVGRAKGLADIAAILRDLLREREDEYLLDCWWSRQQGVQHRQLTDLSKFPKGFLAFRSASNYDTEGEEFFDANSQLEAEEELSDEEEMTADDRERFQREHQELARQEKENEASRIILQFFKNIIMKYHITNLARRALYQEMLEVFAPFAIKETFCGVCGVNLITPETEESVSSSGNQNETEMWDSAEPSLSSVADDLTTAARSQETLQKHRISPEHNEKNIQFESFKRLYYVDHMRKLLHELSFFIGFHKLHNPEMKATAYADVSLDIDRLLSEMDKVKTVLQNIMENRSWEKIEELRHALFTLYQDYLFGRAVIACKFHEYKESGCERDKESPVTEQPHEPSPEVEDPEEYVMPPVVDAPRSQSERGRTGFQNGRGRGRGRGAKAGVGVVDNITIKITIKAQQIFLPAFNDS
ncbi:TPR and ankyrin repeat-containing protein 1-like [Gigantopelta aegis]|uniref:TPR and ankyrin repeat-containing protein 1-like n=1 Tax=Gigantopelta aegis TaxID=1735272 RepID=UPI001B88E274|nr:TPR and ankyrin repeat-containing protein 1-like [Gigantopelta aegis]